MISDNSEDCSIEIYFKVLNGRNHCKTLSLSNSIVLFSRCELADIVSHWMLSPISSYIRTEPMPTPEASVCRVNKPEGNGRTKQGSAQRQDLREENSFCRSSVQITVSGEDFPVASVR